VTQNMELNTEKKVGLSLKTIYKQPNSWTEFYS
jgi:hypothetical protein